MSAFMARVYCQCGEPVKGEPTYCPHCARNLKELGENAMETITNAVREVTDTASDEKREGKYNQQKWGLFETNYQREKGITTEESLQEIEAFSRDGIVPEPAPRRNHMEGVGGEFRADLTKSIESGEEKRKGGGSMVKRLSQRITSLGRKASGSSGGQATATPGSKVSAGKQFTLIEEFQGRSQASNAGAAFFENHQATSRKKFQPHNNLG